MGLLVVPSGVIETDGDSKVSHCSWVFSRVDLARPALCLPTKDKYTIAVRFSPKIYALRTVKKSNTPSEVTSKSWETANSLFCLPYRLIYAVATQNAIMFYDTQQAAPFGRVSNVHYTGLTDLTWSPCGNILFASSSDGYCSIITFSPGELGEEYVTPSTISHENATPNKLPASFASQPTSSNIAEGLNSEGVRSPAQVHIKSTKEGGKSNPKRLQFITLSSPKAEKKLSKLNINSEKTEEDKNSGVEKMDTDSDALCLVLEETQPEAPNPPPKQPSVDPTPTTSDEGAKPTKKKGSINHDRLWTQPTTPS